MKFRAFETNDGESERIIEDVRVSLIMVDVMPDNSVKILSTADEVGRALLRADAIMVAIKTPEDELPEA